MNVARHVPFYQDYGLEEQPMSLVFALLREDHIIFASDSRHVRGGADANYLNDKCCKIETILNNSALLGFAGDDVCESIVLSLKRSGALESGSLASVASEVSKTAAELYRNRFPDEIFVRNVEFLLAGFERDEKGEVARCYRLGAPHFGFLSRTYEPSLKYDTFEVIGRRLHGALYVLRKCAGEALTVESGIRLACFSLTEVGSHDTLVGGLPQIHVIRPNQVEDCSTQLDAHVEWAKNVGERIRTFILSPRKTESTQSRSKRDR